MAMPAHRVLASVFLIALAATIFLGLAASAFAAPVPGALLWSKVYGAAPLADDFYASARCPDGGVVAVGVTGAGVPDASDGLIAKYSASGDLQWSHAFDYGESHDDIFGHVVVDARGNIYAGGGTRSTATGGDYLVVKYSKGGVVRWSRALDGGHAQSDGLGAITLDSSGNPCVTGDVGLTASTSALGTFRLRAFDGDVTRADRWIGPSGSAYLNGWGLARGPSGTLYATGSATGPSMVERVFVVKYRARGGRQWARTYLPAGSTGAWGAGVVAAPDGTPDVLIAVQRASGAVDTGLLKYSTSGRHRVARLYSLLPGGKNWLGGISVDAGGNVFTCGNAVPATPTTWQGYLIKWSPAGKRLWAHLLPLSAGGNSEYRTVLADGAGGAYVAGDIRIASPLATNGLTAHVNRKGVVVWSDTSEHASGNDTFYSLAFIGKAGVSAAGRYQPTPGDDDAVIEKRQK